MFTVSHTSPRRTERDTKMERVGANEVCGTTEANPQTDRQTDRHIAANRGREREEGERCVNQYYSTN